MRHAYRSKRPNSGRFSQTDVDQIKLLINRRPDFGKPIVRIWFDRADRALVEIHQIYAYVQKEESLARRQ